MWNMAVNTISYPIHPLSTRNEKGYLTKMIPFFFCSVYYEDLRILIAKVMDMRDMQGFVSTWNAVLCVALVHLLLQIVITI